MTYAPLKGPRCKDARLQHVELHGETVDTCPACNGVWFDDRQLTEAIRNKHNLQDPYCIKQGFGEPLHIHVYHCHRCNAPMQQYHLLKDYHLEIDSCSRCSGIWVDGNEVAQVLAAPRLQDALEQLNRRVCPRSWVFQFFTRLPKEYNIRPHRRPYMTGALLLLNMLIFLMYAFDSGAADWTFRHFAFDSLVILEGQVVEFSELPIPARRLDAPARQYVFPLDYWR